MYWQANANTPLSVTPLLNVPYTNKELSVGFHGNRRNRENHGNPIQVRNIQSSPNQKFRKGVGGQRGLAQGNPSHTTTSGLVSASFFLCPLMSRRTQFWGTSFAVVWALFP